MQSAVLRFIAALVSPLITLSVLGGLASGVWLAVRGDWGLVGYGVFLWFAASLLLSTFLLPAWLLMRPASKLLEKGLAVPSMILVTLHTLYVYAIIAAWCVGIFGLYLHVAPKSVSIFPVLLWAYSSASGPWTYIAMKENQASDAFATSLSAFTSQLASLALMIAIWVFHLAMPAACAVFGVVVLLALLFSTTFNWTVLKAATLPDAGPVE